jgi:hypothetical protein
MPITFKTHPWSIITLGYPRDEPLAKCPSMVCIRRNECLKKINGRFCQRTHLTQDQLRTQIARKVEAHMKKFRKANPNHVPTEYDLKYGMRDLKRALEERSRNEHAASVQKWNAMSKAEQAAEIQRIEEFLVGRPRA